MALDPRDYRDFGLGLGLNDVDRDSSMELRLDPNTNNGADVLGIYTGTLEFVAKGISTGSWSRGTLQARFPTEGRKWTERALGSGWTGFLRGTVVLSLASIYNEGVANFAGWAVDGTDILANAPNQPQPDDHLMIRAFLAVRDNDGILYRVSYQVCALGNEL